MNFTTLKRVLFSNIFLLYCLLSHSQVTEIRGKVIDGKTKESLSFANLVLKGTLTSTTCDGDGYFYLRTLERSDSLVVTYLGYPRKAIKIIKGKSQTLTVEMGATSFEYKPVEVKAGKRKRFIDTVALYVYHQVVDHKKTNEDPNISTATFEEYSKLDIGLYNPKQKFLHWRILRPFSFAFNNIEVLSRDTTDTGVVDSTSYLRVLLKEDISDVFYRHRPETFRRNIKATKFTGIDNTSFGDLVDYTFRKINCYDEIFVVAGKSFLSPFAHGASGSTYRYFLTDTVRKEGRTIYKIHFVGKSKVDLALKGYAWIDSATWGIKTIFFRPNERSNLNYLQDYTISQTFMLLPGERWMMKSEDVSTIGGIFKSTKRRMKILVQKHLDRRDVSLNPHIEDSIFARAEDDRILPDARVMPREWWDSTRFNPLNIYEKELIHIHDTVKTIPAYRRLLWTTKLVTGAYFKAGPIEFGRFYKFVSKDSIEGIRLRFGGQTNTDFSKKFHFLGYAAYGLRDKEFKYELTAHYRVPSQNERWSMLEFSYRYELNLLGQENPLLTFDNIVSLFRAKPLTKLMKIREWTVNFENEWIRGFTSTIGLYNRTYYNLPGIFDFRTTRPDGSTRTVSQFNTIEAGIDNRYCYHDKYYRAGFYRLFVPTVYPVFLVNVHVGMLDIDGKTSAYARLKGSIQHRWAWILGHTKYEFQAAKIIGKAPYPTAYVTPANQGILFDIYSYNMVREFEFVTDQYLSLYVEHHFEGYFFNKIPLWNRLQLREVLYTRVLWGTYSQANYNLLVPPSDLDFQNKQPYPIPYIEAGFGIENIFKLIRVDFVWRVTHRDQKYVANFSPKFSLNFAF